MKTDALIAAQQKKLADEEAQRVLEAQQKLKAEEEAAQVAIDLEKVKTDALVAAQQKKVADEEAKRVLNAQQMLKADDQVNDDALEFDDTGAEDEEGPAGVEETPNIPKAPETPPSVPIIPEDLRVFVASMVQRELLRSSMNNDAIDPDGKKDNAISLQMPRRVRRKNGRS